VKDSTGARIHPQPVLEDLMKSSLLKECHLTGIPQSWFFEEGLVEGRQEHSSTKQL